MPDRAKWTIALFILITSSIMMLVMICLIVHIALKVPEYDFAMLFVILSSMIFLGCIYGSIFFLLHGQMGIMLRRAADEHTDLRTSTSTERFAFFPDPTNSHVMQMPSLSVLRHLEGAAGSLEASVKKAA